MCVQQDNASKVFGKGKEVFSQKSRDSSFSLEKKVGIGERRRRCFLRREVKIHQL